LKYQNKKFVHVFPHSHTDLGWLGTIDEYFQGKTEAYEGSVKDMLTSVIENLEDSKERTFTYAEMEYFKMWWGLQDQEKKESVRNLIKTG